MRREAGEGLKAEIDRSLESRGLSLREGTVLDASIVDAPSSTKNRKGERDPEMRQTKKGNQWYFGMKMHVGSDAETGIAHSLAVTAANESDVAHATVCCKNNQGVTTLAGMPPTTRTRELAPRSRKVRAARLNPTTASH